MKVMYRPHRGSFKESVMETKFFDSLFDVFKYVSKTNKCFDVGDVIIGYYCVEDRQSNFEDANKNFNWTGDNYIVCVANAFGEDYLEKYHCPQAVGFCKFVEE
nr:MAG TPA: hypothetical protein [Caudoviricetes sp.]